MPLEDFTSRAKRVRSRSAGGIDLLYAAQRGDLNEVKMLIDSGDSVNTADMFGRTLLYKASGNGHLSLVHFLTEREAKINASDNNGWTPLHIACVLDQFKVAELLIERGADVKVADNAGKTPLHIACDKGNLSIDWLLIEGGADVNTVTIYGWTPFHSACRDGDKLASVAKLKPIEIEAIANANTVSTGRKLLNLTYPSSLYCIVLLLIEKGADMNSTNDDGHTPLYLACLTGSSVAQLLIAIGADANIADNDGILPLHIACLKGYKDVAQALIEKESDAYGLMY